MAGTLQFEDDGSTSTYDRLIRRRSFREESPESVSNNQLDESLWRGHRYDKRSPRGGLEKPSFTNKRFLLMLAMSALLAVLLVFILYMYGPLQKDTILYANGNDDGAGEKFSLRDWSRSDQFRTAVREIQAETMSDVARKIDQLSGAVDDLSQQFRREVENPCCSKLKLPTQFDPTDIHSNIDKMQFKLEDFGGQINRLKERMPQIQNVDQHIEPNLAALAYGATVVSELTSPSLHPHSTYSIMNWVARFETNTYPLSAQHPLQLGKCWCFEGSNGEYAVRLAAPAVVEEIVYEHSNWRGLKTPPISAPKSYQVWGCSDSAPSSADQFNCTQLASCEYGSVIDEQIAVCKVESSLTVPIVQLRVDSNHGQDYTCLYALRVHGRSSCSDEECSENGVPQTEEMTLH